MKKLFFALLLISTFSMSAAITNKLVADTNKTDAQGKKTGIWKEKKDMFTYYGTYKNGSREGLWVGYHPNGIISSLEEYQAGKKNGYSIGIDVAGFYNRKETYVNDTLNGTSLIYTNAGAPKIHSQTDYKMGKLNGLKKIYYPDGGLQEEGYFVNNMRHGISRWYTTDGKLSIEYNYKYGNLDGIQKSFFPNGNTSSEVTSVNNLEEGEYTEYFERGKVKVSGKYVHGKKEGTWKEFDEEGNVVKTEKYKNDALVK